MSTSSGRVNLILYLLAAVIVVSGLFFWQSDLTSDPPMYYSGIGQSLGTDPAHYVYHARNRVLFGEWDPFDYGRWTVFQHSLVSGLAYVSFALAEVSLRNANLIGVCLSLAGLLSFLIGLIRYHRPWVLPAVALAWTMNVSLLTYGRLPFLENGLLFLSGLVFMTWCWWGDRTWGAALTGALIAGATLTGKVFGFLLLPAVLATIAVESRRPRVRHLIACCGGFLTGVLLLVTTLYGASIGAAFGYAGEQAYGLRGFPDGLKSPWAFVEHLISYGFSNRIWYLDADLYAILLLGAGLIILLMNRRSERPVLPPSVALALSWIVFTWLALMPLNYSPLRYALMLFPPILILGFGVVDIALRARNHPVESFSRLSLVLLGVLVWWAVYHLIRNLFWFNEPVGDWLVWATAAAGLILALVVRHLMKKRTLVLSRRWITAGLVVLLAGVVVVNVGRVRRYHFSEQTYSIVEANRDLTEILGQGAVVSGAYGPALTINTPHREFIHQFPADVEPDTSLFERVPVTHIAVEASSYAVAREDFPEIAKAPVVSTYWIRDREVGVYRIAELFGQPQAASYTPTNFERARVAFDNDRIDSASAYLASHLQEHPMTKSAGLLQTDLFIAQGDIQAARSLLSNLADTYRTDFYIQMQCGRLYLMLGLSRNDPSMTEMARRYFKRGVEANRFKGDFAMRLAQQTRQAIQGR